MKKYPFLPVLAISTFSIGVLAVVFWLIIEVGFNNFFIDLPNEENAVSSIDSAPFTVSDEDCSVYSAILAKRSQDEVIVINDYTSQGLLADATNINKRESGLTQHTINDYQKKKEKSQKLANNFKMTNRVIFLNEKEEKEIFREGQDGWAKFNKIYPKANGIINFSRVGFNRDKTQALVYRGFGCGWLCGQGDFIVLRKVDGKWIIEQEIGLWVS